MNRQELLVAFFAIGWLMGSTSMKWSGFGILVGIFLITCYERLKNK